jgi:hypothetical protein
VVVHRHGAVVHKWPSEAAMHADVASVEILTKRLDRWDTAMPVERSRLLRGVRLFLETCPNGDDTRLVEDTVDSCCTSSRVARVICVNSGESLLEQPVRE